MRKVLLPEKRTRLLLCHLGHEHGELKHIQNTQREWLWRILLSISIRLIYTLCFYTEQKKKLPLTLLEHYLMKTNRGNNCYMCLKSVP